MPLYELFSALTSAFIVTPIMTIIDTSVIYSQIYKLNFKNSMIKTFNYYSKNKINFKKPFNIMFLVYSSTYSTANLTELYCKKNNIDYNIPTLFLTSIINILTIGYKDKEYSKIFNNNFNRFPKSSYGLFAIRDIITIYSCFIFKNDCINYLSNYTQKNTANFISSILIPISAQTISCPLHILAIDLYKNPNSTFTQRYNIIKSMYKQVCLGRIIRVIPAFCFGGFINDMIKNKQ